MFCDWLVIEVSWRGVWSIEDPSKSLHSRVPSRSYYSDRDGLTNWSVWYGYFQFSFFFFLHRKLLIKRDVSRYYHSKTRCISGSSVGYFSSSRREEDENTSYAAVPRHFKFRSGRTCEETTVHDYDCELSGSRPTCRHHFTGGGGLTDSSIRIRIYERIR